PVKVDASATLSSVAPGKTDSDGKFTFDSAGCNVKIRASKSGYSDETVTESLVSCGSCAPECTTNDECNGSQQCSAQQCTAVQCSCGTITNHQCVSYQCCSNSQCGAGEQCVDHSCQPGAECSGDNDCPTTQYCDSGSCKDVQAVCGVVADHK